jgi:hypothetical protein
MSALKTSKISEKYQLREYDYVDPLTRYNMIQKAMNEIMNQNTFRQKGTLKGYSRFVYGGRQYYNPEIYEDRKTKLRFFVTVEGDIPKTHDLTNWFYNIHCFPPNKKFLNQHRFNIFLLVTYGSISPNKIKGYHEFYINNFIKLSESTFYYGLGQMSSETNKNLINRNFSYRQNNWLPKFFMMNIRSKEHLQSGLNVVFHHIDKIRKSIENFIKTLPVAKN